MAKGYAASITSSATNYWYNDDGESAKYNLVDTDFTYECWIKPNNANGVEASGKLEDTSGDWAFYQAGTNMTCLIYHSAGGQVIGSSAIDTGNWTHYAMVYDNTTNRLYFYVNGVINNSGGTEVGGTFPASNAKKFWIGRVGTIGANWQFDELRVSNTKRYTSDFIVTTKPFKPDLNTIILIHFNEGTGSAITDSADNPLTLKEGGAPPDGWVTGIVDLPSVSFMQTKNYW